MNREVSEHPRRARDARSYVMILGKLPSTELTNAREQRRKMFHVKVHVTSRRQGRGRIGAKNASASIEHSRQSARNAIKNVVGTGVIPMTGAQAGSIIFPKFDKNTKQT